jgi:hypothetical protein
MAIATGAVVLLIGAFFLGRGSAPDLKEGVGEPAAQGLSLRSEEGAVEAATNFARILPGPSGDVDAYYQAMRDLAAPEWQTRAQELADNAVAFVVDQYGKEGHISFQPVRYRIDSFSSEQADIDIWGIVLATNSGGARIEESWLTATLSVVWVDDEWKLGGQTSRGGPTPELLQTGDQVTADQLGGFEEYKSVESP